MTASLVTFLRIRSIPILRRLIRYIRLLFPPLNFITLHYAYFIGVCLITSVIFWGTATPFRSVSYTDSLFFTVSAMTLAGLNTVNLSELNTFQQALLFTLIIVGSTVIFYASSLFPHFFVLLILCRYWCPQPWSTFVGRRLKPNSRKLPQKNTDERDL